VLEFYDNLFRYWAVGLFILIGVICLRDYGWRLAAILGALSSFGAAGYLFGSQPQDYIPFGAGYYFVWFFAALGPVFIWLFSLSQFEDDFSLDIKHYGVAGLYSAFYVSEMTTCWGGPPLCVETSDMAMTFVRLSLLVHMVYVAWQGRADDLLEARRHFRTLYIVLVTVFTGTVTTIETWFTDLAIYTEMYVFQAFSFTVLGMVLVLHIAKADRSVILVSGPNPDRKLPKKQLPADVTERHDLEQITKAVAEDKTYLEAGLTIAALSEKVGLPEHRLRRLINRHLGYRNFSDFLNYYRISEAKERLAIVENRNQQILVIAMDLGYGSLGPFNRAFKERTGLTPSEYRKKALADSE
tara:strand:- start:168 stop:1232 length:1065 start_codon:yes stop_codon:yes gene_type:complete